MILFETVNKIVEVEGAINDRTIVLLELPQ